MLYADSPTLAGLGYVVMDEVHYLADRFRGAVWEEVIIHLPEDVQVVSLSATVSATPRSSGPGSTRCAATPTVVVSEHRPVPLCQHVMVGTRLYDLFTDPRRRRGGGIRAATAPPAAGQPRAAAARPRRTSGPVAAPVGRGRGRTGRRPPPPARPVGTAASPSRAQVVRRLDADGLLPAIVFVFSRAGCDAAVRAVPGLGRAPDHAGRARGDPPRRRRSGLRHLPPADLAVLGWWEWSEALGAGVAAHHAGLLPTFKEVVEELFARGLVRVVFATETLALGINMPARVGGAGAAGEVERRDPRRRHAGGVHPAHRPCGPARDRRRGPRGRAVAARAGPGRGRRAGVDAHVPAALELPPDVQHGGQPRRARSAAAPGPRDPGDLVRAVPGRPGGGRPGPAGAQAGGGARRLRRGDDVPPRRLRRVRPLRRRLAERREGRLVAARPRAPPGRRARVPGGACATAT